MKRLLEPGKLFYENDIGILRKARLSSRNLPSKKFLNKLFTLIILDIVANIPVKQ